MTEKLRVAVLGAGGRMGQAAVQAVEKAEDLELVAALGVPIRWNACLKPKRRCSLS